MSLLQQQSFAFDPAADAMGAFRNAKVLAHRLAESSPDPDRLAIARSFCAAMLKSYWREKCVALGVNWSVFEAPFVEQQLNTDALYLAESLGSIAACVEDLAAGYLLGTVYTSMLPSNLRAQWGSFYTPPPYVERLLDQAEAAGVDWATGSAADPACGGGAFLASIAMRMWKASDRGDAVAVLADVCDRLKGFELDPFAAWMSHVILEATLLPLCVAARRRVPFLIEVGDSLLISDEAQFDLVVGNPPYGKLKLPDAVRAKFSRTLYGHANLYGLFTELGVRLCKRGGVVAFVTPTSFLGGQYFKALREFLLVEAPPMFIDFVSGRDGVFDDVLQETMLTVYVKGGQASDVAVCALEADPDGVVATSEIGRRNIDSLSGPWLIARSASHGSIIEKMSSMTLRLADYGYSVSTGPLVWNRHKDQLRHLADATTYPLVWAESVSMGEFTFSAKKRNHAPYIAPREDQGHLVLNEEAVLVQRTTSKEQSRRLICAVIDRDFIRLTNGVVVENHLNIVKAMATTEVKPTTIARVLNSRAVDEAFRCISGSVAVSAYELNALPLPGHADMLALQLLVEQQASEQLIEKRLCRIYGVE